MTNVVPFKVITASKSCKICKKILPIKNFYSTGNTFNSYCIPCDKMRSRVYKYKNATKIATTGNKYINTEGGFQKEIINGIFARGRRDPAKYKRISWVPNITKEKIYELLQLHYIKMKKQFPETDGKLCEYCKNPWTYIRRPGTRGSGKKTRGSSVTTNFSIDRLDTSITYEEGNLVFCCSGCNNRKNQVRIEDMVNIMNVWMERNSD